MDMGGWLYKCGHFHPSDFVQIAFVHQACDDCKNAQKLLDQAKHLRRRKVTAEPDFKVTYNRPLQGGARKRHIDCRMSY